jgi:hypothetical protein
MKQNIEHTTIRNENLFCNNCGGSYKLIMPIGIKEMTSKIDSFNNLHKDCPKTWEEPKVDQSKDIEQKAMWWIANGRIGLSSTTMWLCFMGQKIENVSYPYDPDDFSRCYALLQVVPEWRERILELGKLSKQWKTLSENWNKLTEMFEQNKKEDWINSEKIGMYEFMRTLLAVS